MMGVAIAEYVSRFMWQPAPLVQFKGLVFCPAPPSGVWSTANTDDRHSWKVCSNRTSCAAPEKCAGTTMSWQLPQSSELLNPAVLTLSSNHAEYSPLCPNSSGDSTGPRMTPSF